MVFVSCWSRADLPSTPLPSVGPIPQPDRGVLAAVPEVLAELRDFRAHALEPPEVDRLSGQLEVLGKFVDAEVVAEFLDESLSRDVGLR